MASGARELPHTQRRMPNQPPPPTRQYAHYAGSVPRDRCPRRWPLSDRDRVPDRFSWARLRRGILRLTLHRYRFIDGLQRPAAADTVRRTGGQQQRYRHDADIFHEPFLAHSCATADRPPLRTSPFPVRAPQPTARLTVPNVLNAAPPARPDAIGMTCRMSRK